MRLSDIDITQLLPYFMREDEFNKALANILSQQTISLDSGIKQATLWDKITNVSYLSDEILDELAKELDIEWYLPNRTEEQPIEQRKIIEMSDKIHQHFGTRWAVQKVVDIYFGEGSNIVEWWEDSFPFSPQFAWQKSLNGNKSNAYFFAITTPKTDMTDQEMKDFKFVVDKVKSLRSHMIIYILYDVMGSEIDAENQVEYDTATTVPIAAKAVPSTSTICGGTFTGTWTNVLKYRKTKPTKHYNLIFCENFDENSLSDIKGTSITPFPDANTDIDTANQYLAVTGKTTDQNIHCVNIYYELDSSTGLYTHELKPSYGIDFSIASKVWYQPETTPEFDLSKVGLTVIFVKNGESYAYYYNPALYMHIFTTSNSSSEIFADVPFELNAPNYKWNGSTWDKLADGTIITEEEVGTSNDMALGFNFNPNVDICLYGFDFATLSLNVFEIDWYKFGEEVTSGN